MLESFVGIGVELLGGNLVSVVLRGSVVLGDLAPGYGDLDFLVVSACDLGEGTITSLVDRRQLLCGGQLGLLGRVLEGAFLPRRMLDPGVPDWSTSWRVPVVPASDDYGWARAELVSAG